MTIFSRTFFSLAATLMFLFACSNDSPPAVASTQDPEATARLVVAELLSIPATDVSLVSIEARKFSDSSLDCPEPGMAYQQVLTDGHHILVEADGRRFDVRVANGYGRICRQQKSNPAPPKSKTPPADTAMLNITHCNFIDVTSGRLIRDGLCASDVA
jgi:hypothetical protein